MLTAPSKLEELMSAKALLCKNIKEVGSSNAWSRDGGEQTYGEAAEKGHPGNRRAN